MDRLALLSLINLSITLSLSSLALINIVCLAIEYLSLAIECKIDTGQDELYMLPTGNMVIMS